MGADLGVWGSLELFCPGPIGRGQDEEWFFCFALVASAVDEWLTEVFGISIDFVILSA
jgi:hypothetical protein